MREGKSRTALTSQTVATSLLGGLVVGALQSSLFNPWDRALYLSVIEKRPFLHKGNWVSPWQGWGQAALQRTLSGGLYFFLQGVILDVLPENLPARSFSVGLLAGSLNGAILNPLASIKYHNWGLGSEFTWRGSIMHAWKLGGCAPFFKGISATISRDAIFGTSYEVGRRYLVALVPSLRNDQRWIFASNMTAAAIATIASSPFNYLRSMQYATPADQSPRRAWPQLLRLWANAKVAECGVASYLQQRLRIGWGTARVAVGMGLAQYVFSRINLY